MAPTVNGVAIPTHMAYSGRYDPPHEPIVHKNGEGIPVKAGAAVATWTWKVLTRAEYEYWAYTILGGGNRHKECDVRIWNEHGIEANFYDAVVIMPRRPIQRNGRFLDVTIEFHRLVDSDVWYYDSGIDFDSGRVFW